MYFVFCKQKTAYEVRISDWSSDVCSSDLEGVLSLADHLGDLQGLGQVLADDLAILGHERVHDGGEGVQGPDRRGDALSLLGDHGAGGRDVTRERPDRLVRSEEHTSELQSLMRI